MARLYVDEHLGGFSETLRESGHDVIAATEPGRQGRTDAWHFREAIADERIILTWNKRDFEYLHRLWTTLRIMGVVTTNHPGILTKEAPRSFLERSWIQLVVKRLDKPGDFGGRMFIWHQHTERWEEDDWKPEE